MKFIFDIDGVIVDSEQLHFDVLKMVVPQCMNNIKVEDLIGMSLEETLRYLGIEDSKHHELSINIVNFYKSQLSKKYLRKGVNTFINKLVAKNISFGFVSTALRDICLSNISLLDIPMNHELLLIAGNDITKTKPYPDPYLKMLQLLDIKPSQAVVIEDTDLGIESAFNAGIKKIYGFPHSLSTRQSYANVIGIIKSLNDDILHSYLNG